MNWDTTGFDTANGFSKEFRELAHALFATAAKCPKCGGVMKGKTCPSCAMKKPGSSKPWSSQRPPKGK